MPDEFDSDAGILVNSRATSRKAATCLPFNG